MALHHTASGRAVEREKKTGCISFRNLPMSRKSGPFLPNAGNSLQWQNRYVGKDSELTEGGGGKVQ
jgi:hypothetical protein